MALALDSDIAEGYTVSDEGCGRFGKPPVAAGGGLSRTPLPAFRGLNSPSGCDGARAHRSRTISTSSPIIQPPLEGQVVDLADEIAYTSADIEDARHELVEHKQLGGLELWKLAGSKRSLAQKQGKFISRLELARRCFDIGG